MSTKVTFLHKMVSIKRITNCLAGNLLLLRSWLKVGEHFQHKMSSSLPKNEEKQMAAQLQIHIPTYTFSVSCIWKKKIQAKVFVKLSFFLQNVQCYPVQTWPMLHCICDNILSMSRQWGSVVSLYDSTSFEDNKRTHWFLLTILAM